MGFFDKKMKSGISEQKQSEVKDDSVKVNERPRICCIDIQKNVEDALKAESLNVYSGTLGDKIEIPNSRRNENHFVLLNYDFPSDLHEYDIVIMDLHHSNTIAYENEERVINNHTGKSAISLLSSYPETLFDPRPLSSLVLRNKLQQIRNRPHMILVFTSSNYSAEYETVKISESRSERQAIEEHGIYSFANNCPLSETKIGKEITVCDIREDLRNLLESLKSEATYNQTFYHPTILENNKNILDPNWVPLLRNSNNEIVSICQFSNSSMIFYLPQFKSNGMFLTEFLSRIAPSIFCAPRWIMS